MGTRHVDAALYRGLFERIENSISPGAGSLTQAGGDVHGIADDGVVHVRVEPILPATTSPSLIPIPRPASI